MRELSPRRSYVMNRFISYGIFTNDREMNNLVEIVVSFHLNDDKIEAGMMRLKKALLAGKIHSLPGFVHTVFRDQAKRQSNIMGGN